MVRSTLLTFCFLLTFEGAQLQYNLYCREKAIVVSRVGCEGGPHRSDCGGLQAPLERTAVLGTSTDTLHHLEALDIRSSTANAPVYTRTLTLKQLKDVIKDIYASKGRSDYRYRPNHRPPGQLMGLSFVGAGLELNMMAVFVIFRTKSFKGWQCKGPAAHVHVT